MQSAAVRLGPIGQITTVVSDLSRAVAFYRDTLGLEQLPIPAQATMAFFNCAGIRLMLSLPEDEVRQAGSVIYFKVQEIEQVYQALKARGVAFMGEPHRIAKLPDHELWMCFLRDPDGNPLALMEEKR